MNLKRALTGVGVAVVTPFNNDFSIDYPSLENHINFLIEKGVDYLVILGTTGETPTMSRDEKIAVVNFAYEIVKDRVPVVIGIGGNNTAALIEDLKTFPLEKATAVLSTSPYYNKPSQEGLFQHYTALAAVSPKPIILYNVPGRTGKNIEPETTLRLAENPNICGIKEAGNNFAQGIKLLANRPKDFLILSGDDDLCVPEVEAGFDGVISVAANAFPAEFKKMIKESLDGNVVEARELNQKLFNCYMLLFAENNPAGIKALMYFQGRIKNVLRLPLVPLSEKVNLQMKAFWENYQK